MTYFSVLALYENSYVCLKSEKSDGCKSDNSKFVTCFQNAVSNAIIELFFHMNDASIIQIWCSESTASPRHTDLIILQKLIAHPGSKF